MPSHVDLAEFGRLIAQISALKMENERLKEALIWCSGHAYAGGKSFADVEPVKSALKYCEPNP